jgi:hypothetical protein
MPLPASAPTPNSNAFARERDARICWLLDSHPVTAAMLVALGLFPSKAKALKRLNRLVQRRRVRLVGTVSRKGGRPEHVFARCRPKPDQLLHEVELTEVCLRLNAGIVLRGPQVTDKGLRPDAEVTIRGHLYYLELDRGSMGFGQIERRFRAYERSRNVVLWVCPSEERREALRRRAERLRHIALFATLADVLAGPHTGVWLDWLGGRAVLPREGKKEGG